MIGNWIRRLLPLALAGILWAALAPAGAAQSPKDLVLVLDASGSM